MQQQHELPGFELLLLLVQVHAFFIRYWMNKKSIHDGGVLNLCC